MRLYPRSPGQQRTPAIVEHKQGAVDWEYDMIIGKAHQGMVATFVGRRSKLTLTQGLPNRTAAQVDGVVQDLLAPFTPPLPLLGTRPQRTQQQPQTS